jgi:erythromycin esterase
LGESSHFIGEYHSIRIRIIKYLHQEKGYKFIAFESPFSNLNFVSENRENMEPRKMLEFGLFSVWKTEEVLELMAYLKLNPDLKVVGFDCQDGNIRPEVSEVYFNKVNLLDPDLGNRYKSILKTFKVHMNAVPRNQDEAFFETNTQICAEIEGLVLALKTKEETDFDLLHHLHSLKNSTEYWSKLARVPFTEAMCYRDSSMAENLVELSRNLFPNQKGIVWGHNAHLSKSSLTSNYPKPMGEYLGGRLKAYHIGLYSYSGEYGKEKRKIKKPSKNHIELLFHENQYNYSFIDLKKPSIPEWGKVHFKTLDNGHGEMELRPTDSFDAIIFLNAVSAPNHLK